MKFWHLHQDWILEVHEDDDPEPCGRTDRGRECKVIAKATRTTNRF